MLHDLSPQYPVDDCQLTITVNFNHPTLLQVRTRTSLSNSSSSAGDQSRYLHDSELALLRAPLVAEVISVSPRTAAPSDCCFQSTL